MIFRLLQRNIIHFASGWFSFYTPWRQIILAFLSKFFIVVPLTLAKIKKIPGNLCTGIFSMINFEKLRFQRYQFRLDNNLFPCWPFMTSLRADYTVFTTKTKIEKNNFQELFKFSDIFRQFPTFSDIFRHHRHFPTFSDIFRHVGNYRNMSGWLVGGPLIIKCRLLTCRKKMGELWSGPIMPAIFQISTF